MRSRRRLLRGLLVAALAVGCSVGARAELYVVVSAKSSVRALAPREAIALFTGRAHTFPDGQEAEPFDQSESGGTRATFYKALTGMDLARINSYWSRLRFSGQVQPPRVLGDDKDVIAMARQNAKAVGYLRSPPNDAAVRVVLVLEEAFD